MRGWVVALLLSVATPAFAQPEPAETPAQLAIVKAKAAREHYDAGDWEAALGLFREAEALYHSPVLVLYQARSLRNLKRLREARQRYQALAEEQLADTAPEPWKQAQRDGVTDLGSLQIPTIAIVVTGAPEAKATLDGEAVPLEAEVDVDPGDHQIVVVASHRREEKTITVSRGQRLRPAFDMTPRLVLPPSQPPPLPVHEKPVPVPIVESSLNVPALVLTIIGGAGIATGVGVGVAALRKSKGADGRLPNTCHEGVCPSTETVAVDDEYDTALSFAAVSDVLWIAGAITAAAGIALWIFDPFDSTAPSDASNPFTVRF